MSIISDKLELTSTKMQMLNGNLRDSKTVFRKLIKYKVQYVRVKLVSFKLTERAIDSLSCKTAKMKVVLLRNASAVRCKTNIPL